MEERFAQVKGQPAEDGRPIVLEECLVGWEEITITFVSGARARIRYLPSRRRVEGRSTNRGEILWFVLPDAPTYVYRVTPRRRPNTPLHLTLGDPQQSQQKLSHPGQLRAAFFLLFGMGDGYSGLYNATSPGRSELFHFQFFGVRLPLWSELEAGRVSVRNRHSEAGEVSIGHLHGWPFEAPVFEAEDPGALASSVWTYLQEPSHRGDTVVDILFNHGSAGVLRAIAARRSVDRACPQTFYPPRPTAYGAFGGLELSGLVVNISEEEVFRFFERDRDFAARCLEEALREVTRV